VDNTRWLAETFVAILASFMHEMLFLFLYIIGKLIVSLNYRANCGVILIETI